MSAVARNASSASANNAVVSFGHTLFAGASLLTVEICLDADLTVLSVAWDDDGVSEFLSAVASTVQDNAGNSHTVIYELVNPSAATGSSLIEVQASAKGQNIAGALDFTGAAGCDNGRGSTGNAASSSETVANVTNDDWVIDAIRQPGGALVVGADQTAHFNISAGGERGGGSNQEGILGGVMSWTWPASAQFAHSACRVRATAAADVNIHASHPQPVAQEIF